MLVKKYSLDLLHTVFTIIREKQKTRYITRRAGTNPMERQQGQIHVNMLCYFDK